MSPKLLLILLISLAIGTANATNKAPQSPKLIVGIVIDQMKYDYLQQFRSHFGKGGFNRLMLEGMNCTQTNYNYIPTYTAPGHASIYTGTTPANHGIVGNEWYEATQQKVLYCVSDTTVYALGTNQAMAGKMSPKNLNCSTITDELKSFNVKKSKVIGIALKDRGAILPAGHQANAAYWFEGVSGNWISSSYYFNELPNWVSNFNKLKQAQNFSHTDWQLDQPIANYLFAAADSNAWENKFTFEKGSQFPHRFSQFNAPNSDIIRASPWGNTFTKNFAIAAIEGEQLGKGDYPDFLTVSFSSTDYVGHQFGPNSLEIEDVYTRLDKDLDSFLTYLDLHFGKENVLVFLTADHGVAPIPGYAAENHLPGGVAKTSIMLDSLKKYLNTQIGKGNWVVAYENQQIYLNAKELRNAHLEKMFVVELVLKFFQENPFPGVKEIFSLSHADGYAKSVYAEFIKNGYNASRSGDVLVTYQSGWIENAVKGTTHGTFYTYDTHVPLLFWGWHIPKKEISTSFDITAISPTIAYLLRIPMPSGATGKPIPINKAERKKGRFLRK